MTIVSYAIVVQRSDRRSSRTGTVKIILRPLLNPAAALHLPRRCIQKPTLFARHTLTRTATALSTTNAIIIHTHTRLYTHIILLPLSRRGYIFYYMYIYVVYVYTHACNRRIFLHSRVTHPKLLIKTARRYRISGLTGSLHPYNAPLHPMLETTLRKPRSSLFSDQSLLATAHCASTPTRVKLCGTTHTHIIYYDMHYICIYTGYQVCGVVNARGRRVIRIKTTGAIYSYMGA